MGSFLQTTDRSPREWRAILLWTLPYLMAVAIFSQVSAEGAPGACDENVSPGTDLYEGCQFLEDGGYTAIKVVPSGVVIAFALLGARLRRVGLVHAGFLLALVLLSLAFVPPADYPL